MARIRLPSHTVPPRGAIASPNTVVISEPARKVGPANDGEVDDYAKQGEPDRGDDGGDHQRYGMRDEPVLGYFAGYRRHHKAQRVVGEDNQKSEGQHA